MRIVALPGSPTLGMMKSLNVEYTPVRGFQSAIIVAPSHTPSNSAGTTLFVANDRMIAANGGSNDSRLGSTERLRTGDHDGVHCAVGHGTPQTPSRAIVRRFRLRSASGHANGVQSPAEVQRAACAISVQARSASP